MHHAFAWAHAVCSSDSGPQPNSTEFHAGGPRCTTPFGRLQAFCSFRRHRHRLGPAGYQLSLWHTSGRASCVGTVCGSYPSGLMMSHYVRVPASAEPPLESAVQWYGRLKSGFSARHFLLTGSHHSVARMQRHYIRNRRVCSQHLAPIVL